MPDVLDPILKFLTPISVGLGAGITIWFNAHFANRQKEDADKVVEVAQQNASITQETNGKILELADKTHTLVNSQMGQQLMLYAISARTLANLTKNKDHIKLADAAEQKLASHQRKQAIVDATDNKEV